MRSNLAELGDQGELGGGSSGKLATQAVLSSEPMLGGSQPPLSPAVASHVRAAIAASALTFERRLAIGRIALFLALLVHYAVSPVASGVWQGANLVLVPGILLSLYIVSSRPDQGRDHRIPFLSVSLDAAAVVTSLLENVRAPWVGYPGLLALPESSALLLATVAAGLRLSAPSALLGGGLNSLGLVILVAADRSASGILRGNDANAATYYGIYLGAATALAIIIALTTRQLVMRGAAVALRADQAERGLGSVLTDCHDARSGLTAVRLSAELIQRNLDHLDGAVTERMRQAAKNLMTSLSQVESLVFGVKERALHDLRTSEPPVDVAVAPVIERAMAEARLRFAGVQIEPDEVSVDCVARIKGGELALYRIVANLLANACEGDGTMGARHVRLSARSDHGHGSVSVTVADDGPGIGPTVPLRSIKARGSGVGLGIVRGITEASGGRLLLEANPTGGTRAIVELPLAPPPREGVLD